MQTIGSILQHKSAGARISSGWHADGTAHLHGRARFGSNRSLRDRYLDGSADAPSAKSETYRLAIAATIATGEVAALRRLHQYRLTARLHRRAPLQHVAIVMGG